MSTVPTPLPVAAEADAGPARRSRELLGAAGLIGVVIGAVVGVLVAGVVGLVVGLVVVGVAVPALLWWRAAAVVEPAGPDAAVDPAGTARLVNLVEGLAAASGIKVPSLRVVPGPGCNLAVYGLDAARATLVVTAPTLSVLDRMELEGLLATGAAAIRRGDARPGTLAAAVGGPLAARSVGAQRDRLLDEAAVAITRYPPGLIAAYEKLVTAGTAVDGASGRAAHLWLVDPSSGADRPPVAYRTPLRRRIDALAEL